MKSHNVKGKISRHENYSYHMQTNKNLTKKKSSLLFENLTLYEGIGFLIIFIFFFRILALVSLCEKGLKDIRMLNS